VDSAFWQDRSVLVTGATGLLGSWMTRALADAGANVVCLVRDQVPRSELVRSGTIHRVSVARGDLDDYATVLRVVNEYEVETVFHLGAQTIVGTASRSALSTFEANIRGTWHLLEACRACAAKVKRVVVASSDKAYGAHPTLPYTEEAPLQGRFPYDVSKSCADLIATSYFETHRLPVGITRCGNLYGGGDLNWSRIVPGTIRSVLRGERPVIRSDGRYVRDYFYVEEAVAAYLEFAERMDDPALHGQAFNFGTETPLTVVAVVEKILAAMGASELTPIVKNEATHEIREQYLDCAKARTRLGWRARFPMERGLPPTIEWYRSFLASVPESAAAGE
jgi:CDP-glucose 4,6-dehydratase